MGESARDFESEFVALPVELKSEPPKLDIFDEAVPCEPIDTAELNKLATKIELLEAELRRCALYDETTGLYNMRGFGTVGEQQLRISDRYNKETLFICTDLSGIEEGDEEIVKQVSSVVKESFRTSDIIARIGFQSFGVLAVETTQVNARRLVERLQKNIQGYEKKQKLHHAIKVDSTVVLYNPDYPCSMGHLLHRVGKELPQNE